MEILVASAVLAISVIGLASVWLFTMRSSVEVDYRSTASECARQVMERAHSIGFFAQGYQPATNSAPASEPIANYRFFDASLVELATSNASTMPSPPPSTVYVATTQIAWIQWGAGNPAYRDDQDQMTVTITVQQVDVQGALSDPVVALQSILTDGGL